MLRYYWVVEGVEGRYSLVGKKNLAARYYHFGTVANLYLLLLRD